MTSVFCTEVLLPDPECCLSIFMCPYKVTSPSTCRHIHSYYDLLDNHRGNQRWSLAQRSSARWHSLRRTCVHSLAAVSTRLCHANVNRTRPDDYCFTSVATGGVGKGRAAVVAASQHLTLRGSWAIILVGRCQKRCSCFIRPAKARNSTCESISGST